MEVKRELLERAANHFDAMCKHFNLARLGESTLKDTEARVEAHEISKHLRAALSAPERKPMTLDEIKSNPVISYFGVDSGEKIVRAVEAFHKVKGTP